MVIKKSIDGITYLRKRGGALKVFLERRLGWESWELLELGKARRLISPANLDMCSSA